MLRHAVEQVRRGDRAALRPPGYGNDALPRVDADDDALRSVGGERLLDERGLLNGGGAEDDTVDAVGYRLVDGVGGAEAAAELDGDADSGGDGAHLVDLRAPPLPRAVQVDDVDAGRAVSLESPRDADGVVAERRLAVVVALEEANDGAAAQVYGGDDLHGLRSLHHEGRGQARRRRFCRTWSSSSICR